MGTKNRILYLKFKYRIQTYKKNVDDNTESSTGTNVGKQIQDHKQDSFPWSGTTTLDQNFGSLLELLEL